MLDACRAIKFVQNRHSTSEPRCESLFKWDFVICKGCDYAGGGTCSQLVRYSVAHSMEEDSCKQGSPNYDAALCATDANRRYCKDWFVKIDKLGRNYIALMRGLVLSVKLMCCDKEKWKLGEAAYSSSFTGNFKLATFNPIGDDVWAAESHRRRRTFTTSPWGNDKCSTWGVLGHDCYKKKSGSNKCDANNGWYEGGQTGFIEGPCGEGNAFPEQCGAGQGANRFNIGCLFASNSKREIPKTLGGLRAMPLMQVEAVCGAQGYRIKDGATTPGNGLTMQNRRRRTPASSSQCVIEPAPCHCTTGICGFEA